MLPRTLCLSVLLFGAALVNAKEPAGAPPKDDANQSAYASGWNESGGGTGFGAWKFVEGHGAGESYAGHFLADISSNPELHAFASNGKVFGLYANGAEYETATAFRTFSAPLQTGDTFSFEMMNPVIEQKGAKDDPGQGSIGLSLRNGNGSDSPDDYNKGARFEIINLKGASNYLVYDGETEHDTGVTYSEQGITVTVTLTGADSYDLAITRLADNTTTKLTGRKLGGSGSIESFCVFNRNGEKADGFFNNFSVHGKGH